jgi:hypothetical protein
MSIISSVAQLHVDVAERMLEKSWTAILASLSTLLNVTPIVIPSIRLMAVTCGKRGLLAPRDAFMTLLSKQSSANHEMSILCLHTLLACSLDLIDTLGSSWSLVLDAICTWERHKRSQGSNFSSTSGQSSATLLVSQSISKKATSLQSNLSFEQFPDIDSHLLHVLSATRELSDGALTPILSAFCQFSTIPTMVRSILNDIQ